MTASYDVVVVGAGPGGYVCAIRAAQLGLRTAIVEKGATLGGTCLNVGCIPSKALLESSERYEATCHELSAHGIDVDGVRLNLAQMMARKEAIVSDLVKGVRYLMKRNDIDVVHGHGRVRDSQSVVVTLSESGEEQCLETKSVVLATGSTPTPLPGVAFDGDRIASSTEALSWDQVPEHLIVIGAGVIGLELGSVWRRLGSRVTVLEYADRILPGTDAELAREAHKTFKAQGMDFVLGARVSGGVVDGDAVCVTWTDKDDGAHQLTGDRVLVAVGRRPATDSLGCEAAGITRDERGRLVVDEHLQTTLPGVYAIGDAIRGPMLAHKAEDEGLMVAEHLAGRAGHVNYDAVPGIVYTHPEIASVGRSEEALKADGVPYRKGRFRYASNGRAKALGETNGFVKLLAHAESDRILGAHVIGARAGDLIAELALAVEFSASAEDVARSIHAHPTLAEVVREAALDVDGRAIHK